MGHNALSDFSPFRVRDFGMCRVKFLTSRFETRKRDYHIVCVLGKHCMLATPKLHARPLPKHRSLRRTVPVPGIWLYYACLRSEAAESDDERVILMYRVRADKTTTPDRVRRLFVTAYSHRAVVSNSGNNTRKIFNLGVTPIDSRFPAIRVIDSSCR